MTCPILQCRCRYLMLATVLATSSVAHGALVSHWKLDELAGPASDSADGNNGSVGGGITRGAPGQIGTAYALSGAGAVTVADAASLKPTSFTVSAWLDSTDSGIFRGVVDKIQSGVGGYSLDMTSGMSRFLVHNGSFVTINGPIVNDGNWHMLTGTYDAGTSTIRFYVDGVLQGTNSTALAHTTEPLVIGGDGISSLLITGSMDDVGLWDEALSAARVLQIYNAGLLGLDLTFVPVPEPSTLMMLGLGTVGITLRRRLRAATVRHGYRSDSNGFWIIANSDGMMPPIAPMKNAKASPVAIV